MSRLMLASLAGMLLAGAFGCRVLPDLSPVIDPRDSLAKCWQARVRRPADWCWGNCPMPAAEGEGPQIGRLDERNAK